MRLVQAIGLASAPSFVDYHHRLMAEAKTRGPRGQLDYVWWLSALQYMLGRAEPYFVSREITALLGQVATAHRPPEWTLRLDDLPSPYGFCWFEADPLPPDPDDPTARLRALSWGVFYAGADGRQVTLADGKTYLLGHGLDWRPGSTGGVYLRAWWGNDLIADAAPVVPIHGWTTLEGGRADAPIHFNDEADRGTRFAQEVVWLQRLWVALCLFCDQRLLQTRRERVERQARKEAARRGWLGEPLVNVVVLRRREAAADGAVTSAEPVPWSCRWVVRGHWRQQWYPSERRHKPLWILPHVKGPEEKPLKAPRADVFAVVR